MNKLPWVPCKMLNNLNSDNFSSARLKAKESRLVWYIIYHTWAVQYISIYFQIVYTAPIKTQIKDGEFIIHNQEYADR